MMYLFQVSSYTGAMILIYVLFLRNKPLHLLSRVYLIAAAVFPLFLPMLSLPGTLQNKIQQITSFQFTLPAITINASAQKMAISGNNIPVMWIVYGAISILLLTWFMAGAIQIKKAIAQGEREARRNYVLLTSTGLGPGSFGKYIFFPGGEVDATILAHEEAHICKFHTADIILLSLLQSVFWPNIFLAWITKEIKQVHEFEADAVLQVSPEEYSKLLLSSVFNTRTISIIHSFINQPLNRRIMMLKKRNGIASPLKATMLVAASVCIVIILGMGIQSCDKGKNKPQDQPLHKTDGTLAAIPNNTQDAYSRADVMPVYDAKNGSISDYLAKSLKYPEDAKTNKIEGRVVVKFMVTKDGSVTNAEVVRSPDASLSQAALDAIRNMPKWVPGHMNDGKNVNVWFYLPVSFKLS